MTGNDDPSSRFTGRFETLYAALTSASNSTEAAAQLTAGATSSILARVSSTFSVDAPDACARQLGTNGCGRSPPLHCAALPRFRFYLYEQDTAPSPEAAELYYALRDSPLRTLDGDRDRGEACVYVAVGDVRAANVQALPPAAAARAYSRLPHWNGTGADHLIFNFGDYALPFDTGRAMLAASSFGAAIDRAFFRPSSPESLPQMAEARAGYDVTAPLPFYRCGLPLYAHLHRFDSSLPAAVRVHNGTLAAAAHVVSALVSAGPHVSVGDGGSSSGGSRRLALMRAAALGGASSSSASPPLHGVWPAWGSAAAAEWTSDALAAPLGVPPPASRPLMLAFRGAAYTSYPGYAAEVRSAGLRLLHDEEVAAAAPAPSDVEVLLTCKTEAPACVAGGSDGASSGGGGVALTTSRTSADARCSAWEAEAAAATSVPTANISASVDEGRGSDVFADQLLRTRFAAVPPGEGTHSYRLYEALQAGAVPVLLGAAAASPPLQHTLPWAHAAVLQEDTSPAAMRALLARLRAAPDDLVARMQAAGRRVWLSALASLPLQVHGVLAEVAANMRDARARLRSEAEAATEKTAAAAAVAAAAASAASTVAMQSTRPSSATEDQPPAGAAPAAVGSLADGIAVLAAMAGLPPPACAWRPRARAACTAAALAARGREADALLNAARQAVAAAPPPPAPAPDAHAALKAAINATLALLHAASAAMARATADEAAAASLATVKAAANLQAATGGRACCPLGGEGAAADRAAVRAAADDASARGYAAASALYAAAGAWRLSATAAAAAALHAREGASGGEAAVMRVRNAVYDTRRVVDVAALQRAGGLRRSRSVGVEGASAVVSPPLGRLRDALDTDADAAAGLSGYGSLAHFLSPAPLAPLGGPGAALLPLSACTLAGVSAGEVSDTCLASEQSIGALLPVAALSEAALQRVAAALRDDAGLAPGALPFPMQSSLPTHARAVAAAVANDSQASARAPALTPAPTPTPRVVIVSMCAYDANVTALGALSTANLDRYCRAHGLACYASTGVADPRRAPAWSKVPLLARVMAHLDDEAAAAATAAATAAVAADIGELPVATDDWLLWKDCDTFIMRPDIPPAALLAAAGAARARIAAAAAHEALAEAATEAAAEAMQAAPGSTADGVGRSTLLSLPPALAALSPLPLPLPLQPPPLPSSLLSLSPSPKVHLPAGFASVGTASAELIISEDGFMLNSGVFALRRGAWARALLRRMYGDAAASQQSSTGGAWPRVEAALFSAPAPADRNRAWEQAALFATLLGTRGAPQRASSTGGSSTEGDSDACERVDSATAASSCLADAIGGIAPSMHETAHVGLSASDAARTQVVPQRWLNSYPPTLAARLHDDTGAPMHGAYGAGAGGDWLVSFSGCAVLLPSGSCEKLYAEYAELAKKAHDDWQRAIAAGTETGAAAV